jgi:aryl-alcohol dehydrogenase-like predicted oxidoreductase
MPRFNAENYSGNLGLLVQYEQIARAAGCTMAQLALAWLLSKDEIIVPIFGTRMPERLEENAGGAEVNLDPSIIERLDGLINEKTVAGPRYNAATQLEIDTESF